MEHKLGYIGQANKLHTILALTIIQREYGRSASKDKLVCKINFLIEPPVMIGHGCRVTLHAYFVGFL
jgi:hypothetical protein